MITIIIISIIIIIIIITIIIIIIIRAYQRLQKICSPSDYTIMACLQTADG